jgi:hypothetical protein
MPGKHGNWTVLFEDKIIIKKTEEYSSTNCKEYKINDDSFWNQSKFNGINAIQFTNDGQDNDQVETQTANVSYNETIYGSFQQFVDKWDAAHLAQLQSDWDEDNVEGETSEEKITRLGNRPTSYNSTPIV